MSEIVEHFTELVTDPGHLLFELFFTLAFDCLILGALWPFVKRAIHRHIDSEHGVTHPDPQENRSGGYPATKRASSNVKLVNGLAGVASDDGHSGGIRPSEQRQERHSERARVEVVCGLGSDDGLEVAPSDSALRDGMAVDSLPDRRSFLMTESDKPLKCSECLTRPEPSNVHSSGPTHDVVHRWNCEDCGMYNEEKRATS